MREYGWFKKESGRWEKRKYTVGEEVPHPTGPPDAADMWNGNAIGGARELTAGERASLFIQHGKEFRTLRDVEVWGKANGHRIAESFDTQGIEDTVEEYPHKVTEDGAGAQAIEAEKLLTRDPKYLRPIQTGGIHAEQARREGRG